MASRLHRGPVLGKFYGLPRGPRVGLRLVRISDSIAIERLFRGRGIAADELDVARLVRPDPRSRVVIVATTLIGSTETVVGVGALDLEAGRLKPDMLVVDDDLTDGLDDLLTEALVWRVQAARRHRAA